MSRAFSQAGVGAYLGACGVGYGAIGGLLALGGQQTALTDFGAPHLLMGCALALVLATLAAFGIVAGWDGFFGAGAAATVGAIACVVRLVFDTDAAAAAAIAIAIALAATPFVPTFSARLARLPIPQLPTGADDLRRQTDMLPGPTVLQQAITADRLVAALIAASTAVAIVGSIFLIRDGGWFGPSLTGVIALALLLRARHFLGRTQRLWLISGGVVCACLLVFRLVTQEQSAGVLLIVGLPCLIVGAALGGWAVAMPGRRVSPYWARATDLFEVLVLLAVVPLTLGVVGVYRLILEWLG
jgi:type VII secretion integral membrane protein EccD